MPRLREDVAAPRLEVVGRDHRVRRLRWPQGARVAVSFVVVWDEDGLTASASGEEDAAAGAHEYGLRAGVWRLGRLFDRLHIPVTVLGSAVALERNPGIAAWIRRAGHEVCAYERAREPTREEERECLLDTIRSIERTCGQRPRGWCSHSAPSAHTRELLVEEGGFAYDSDSCNDDLPYYTEILGHRHLVVPSTAAYDDMRYARSGGPSLDPSPFFEQCRRGLDYLWEEGVTHPKMMSIVLHPSWAGQAANASALRDFIEHAVATGDVWFARRIEIAEWWHATFDGAAGAS